MGCGSSQRTEATSHRYSRGPGPRACTLRMVASPSSGSTALLSRVPAEGTCGGYSRGPGPRACSPTDGREPVIRKHRLAAEGTCGGYLRTIVLRLLVSTACLFLRWKGHTAWGYWLSPTLYRAAGLPGGKEIPAGLGPMRRVKRYCLTGQRVRRYCLHLVLRWWGTCGGYLRRLPAEATCGGYLRRVPAEATACPSLTLRRVPAEGSCGGYLRRLGLAWGYLRRLPAVGACGGYRWVPAEGR